MRVIRKRSLSFFRYLWEPNTSPEKFFLTKPYILGCKIGCLLYIVLIINYICGERGIRTPGTPKGTTDFESAPIDHSGSSPSLIP